MAKRALAAALCPFLIGASPSIPDQENAGSVWEQIQSGGPEEQEDLCYIFALGDQALKIAQEAAKLMPGPVPTKEHWYAEEQNWSVHRTTIDKRVTNGSMLVPLNSEDHCFTIKREDTGLLDIRKPGVLFERIEHCIQMNGDESIQTWITSETGPSLSLSLNESQTGRLNATASYMGRSISANKGLDCPTSQYGK